MQITNAHIFDPESAVEIARWINLDRMTTTAMGDIFAGLPVTNRPSLSKVLDLACGPGSWVLDVAFANPQCEVAGVDSSQTVVEYAWARARSQQIFNASFGVMDITEPLDFSENTFDLVNARFLMGSLRSKAWELLIAECMRVLRPGGLLCLTDSDGIGETSSPAFAHLTKLLIQAMRISGYSLSPDGHTLGIIPHLPQMLRQAGFRPIWHTAHMVDVSAGTTAWTDFFHNAEVVYLQAQPFLIETGLVTHKEIERMDIHMLIELQAKDFCGIWPLHSFCGKK